MSHRDQLRRELLEAARRRAETQRQAEQTPGSDRAGPQARRIGAWLAAAAAVVGAALVGAGAFGTTPVAASVFDINEDDDYVIIDVIGKVSDPQEAAAELEAAGIIVEMVGRPAAPSLVGDIVAVQAPEGSLPDIADDGIRVEGVRLPAKHRAVRVEYGREARNDERYEASEPPPGCSGLAGERLTRSMATFLTRAHGPRIRWDILDLGETDVALDAIVGDVRIATILPLSPAETLVVVTTGDEAPDAVRC